MRGHRLEVWGDPIAHSRSPILHAAAYRALGLDWHYGRRRVDAAGFASAFAALDDTWRGLSVTMPLKEHAFAAAASRDHHAQLTGAVNTLLLGAEPAGFNTDVGGILDALAESGTRTMSRTRILGAGATAASALVAVAEGGADYVEIRARRPERAELFRSLGGRLGIAVSVTGFEAPVAPVDLTVATLPSGTVLGDELAAPLSDAGGALFEAAYAPWPSALAGIWQGGQVKSGLAMLLHQAIRQVRVFVHGDPQHVLDDEHRVRDEMRSALMGD
ncbi:shikimate dehydrogenase [Microbacterium abyssi]|uniref:shikimate dehydrogenase n=1 Tax=Microbacterium abyssi TaxID=2782166 RepID=UPI0018891531|nr:shikimate dehydrogenase [Microbacterium sp. A18JL241]